MDIIGFIGLGIMGESMCENIINAGYETWVYDIEPEKVEKLASLGGKPSQDITELATHANRVIIMVPNNEHVEDVISKLLPVMQKDTIIIDMSTISPDISKKLAVDVENQECHMIDAPVVKSKAAAIAGDLGILVGGDRDIFDKVKPILDCMGKNIIHMGPNGSGLAMKLCHNMLVGEIQNGVNEMLVLAQAAGLHFDDVIKAISYGGGQNFYLDVKSTSLKARDFSPKFPFEHMNKDMQLVIRFAGNLGLFLPCAHHVKDIYKKGMEKGLQREDFSATLKLVQQEGSKGSR
ncbi:NAD-binding protein [Candidatus Bathyarchaeota archaeon]|nr:NAD-binding protein [Candidatus Bathyarchaeota archaeon]